MTPPGQERAITTGEAAWDGGTRCVRAARRHDDRPAIHGSRGSECRSCTPEPSVASGPCADGSGGVDLYGPGEPPAPSFSPGPNLRRGDHRCRDRWQSCPGCCPSVPILRFRGSRHAKRSRAHVLGSAQGGKRHARQFHGRGIRGSARDQRWRSSLGWPVSGPWRSFVFPSRRNRERTSAPVHCLRANSASARSCSTILCPSTAEPDRAFPTSFHESVLDRPFPRQWKSSDPTPRSVLVSTGAGRDRHRERWDLSSAVRRVSLGCTPDG